jgi:hypothetical protein
MKSALLLVLLGSMFLGVTYYMNCTASVAGAIDNSAINDTILSYFNTFCVVSSIGFLGFGITKFFSKIVKRKNIDVIKYKETEYVCSNCQQAA